MADGPPLVLRSGPRELPPPNNQYATNVKPAVTQTVLVNGVALTIKKAWTGTVIAQSQTDAAWIPAPPSDQFYIAVLSQKIKCDAATLVTINSKGSGAGVKIDGPWHCAAGVAEIEPFNPAILYRAVAGEAVTLTTGAGGNTTARAQYIEVPISIDLL